MTSVKRYSLETVVFLSGVAVMALELVGTHILAPYVGTSQIVWSALIGIILASLGAGYWLGGRLADRRATSAMLSLILALSAFAVLVTAIMNRSVLERVSHIADLRLSATLAATALFLPASLLLGMVSPYAVRLRLTNVEESGRTVGTLSALSTVGSIVGTFLTGFVLLGYFGSESILYGISVLLLVISFLASFRYRTKSRLMVLLFAVVLLPVHQAMVAYAAEHGFVDVDTPYNRVWIADGTQASTGQAFREMLINHENSSAMYLEGNDLVFEYTKLYRLADYFRPGSQRALMLGGAGYSAAKDYLQRNPQATLDVAEIDPGLTELARDYFNLPLTPRLHVANEDGRVYLNRYNGQKYDVIFGDAFQSLYSLPFQLTTREAVQRMADALDEKGVVLENIIGSIDGQRSEFVRAEYATFKSVFPNVQLFPVGDPNDGEMLQNIMLVATKFDKNGFENSANEELEVYLAHRWRGLISPMPPLNDDYAPVDRYTTHVLLAH